MDKNTITGFVLIAVILIGFTFMNRPSEEDIAKQQRYNDLIFRNRLEAKINFPKIMNTVYLMSEPQYSHISSSDIRLMERYEKGSAKKLICKSYENYN